MNKKIWFAIALILAAALIVAGSLGYLGPLSAGQIVLLCFMCLWMCIGIKELWFAGIFVPLGILYIGFNDKLGIPFIGTVATLAIIFCLSIAFDIIFEPIRKKLGKKAEVTVDFNSDKKQAGSSSANVNTKKSFYEMIKLGSKVRYINSSDFESGRVKVEAGNMELYFNNVTVPSGACTLEATIKMGNLVLYIPSSWIIADGLNKTFANVEDSNPVLTNSDQQVTLTLVGEVTMGNIEIKRI